RSLRNKGFLLDCAASDFLRVARESAVFTAEIKQRLSLVNHGVFHFPDKNRVIARKMRRDDVATQVEQRVFKDRDAARGPTVADGQALLGLGALLAAREVLGNGLLPFLKDADAAALFLLEQRKNFRAVIDA